MIRKIRKGLLSIILLGIGIIICMPVIMVVFGSLKSGLELSTSLAPILNGTGDEMKWNLFPQYPTFMHYVKLLFYRPQFFTVFWNSIKIVGLILLGQLLVATPAAWAMARYSFKVGRGLLRIYILLMLMPFQVMMLPSYLLLNQMGLINTHAAIILPAVFCTFPVFLMYQSFREIPESILESARIDGAGDFQLFWHIGVPVGANGILCAMTLGFLDYWNLIEQPLAFLRDKILWPLSLFLPEISLGEAGMALTASVITLIPAVFVFIMGQDYLEMGISASGLKE